MGMFDDLYTVQAVRTAQKTAVDKIYGNSQKTLERNARTLAYVEGKLATFDARVKTGELDIESASVIETYEDLQEQKRCVSATSDDIKLETESLATVVIVAADLRVALLEGKNKLAWENNLDNFIFEKMGQDAPWDPVPGFDTFEDNFIDQK